jgi:hypothetical protein
VGASRGVGFPDGGVPAFESGNCFGS